jgi:type I restriction enzyme M protein
VQLPSQLFFGTGIPACLWFLSKSRDGSGEERKRDDEILFIDARDLGEMATRTQRVLDEEEVRTLEEVYSTYRKEETPDDEPGFYAVASLDEVRGNDYKLTPGLYVGFADDEDDGVPFEIKMPQLIDELENQFAESDRLQQQIRSNLNALSEIEPEA